jgi:hypothetical protein
MLLKSSKQHQVRLNTRSPSIEVVAVFGGVMPNKRFERDAPPASFACRLRAPQAARWASEAIMKSNITFNFGLPND